jgi:hypothetical protein
VVLIVESLRGCTSCTQTHTHRSISISIYIYIERDTASVVQWSEFLAVDTEVPDSIPGVNTFSV